MSYADPNPHTYRGRLRNALMKLIEEHRQDGAMPTNNRFLFYELVQLRIVSKAGKTKGRRSDQDVSAALTDLRESGHVEWDEIIDEMRRFSSYAGTEDIVEEWLDYLGTMYLDPWNGKVPVIITESRSLAGVLRSLAAEYRVCITTSGGMCNGFLRTKVAPQLDAGDIIGYLGDYDLAGNDIENNTRGILEEVVGPLNWTRLALTAEQVRRYRLPVIVKTDKRFKNGGGVHEAVETEALKQTLIVRIVRDWLDELLPQSLDDVRVREEAEWARLRALVEDAAR